MFCVHALHSFQNVTLKKKAYLKEDDYPTAKSRLDRFEGLNRTVNLFVEHAKVEKDHSFLEATWMTSHKFYSALDVCFSVMHNKEDFSYHNNLTSFTTMFDFNTQDEWFFGKKLLVGFYPRQIAPFFLQERMDNFEILSLDDVVGRDQYLNASVRINLEVTFEETEMHLLPHP